MSIFLSILAGVLALAVLAVLGAATLSVIGGRKARASFDREKHELLRRARVAAPPIPDAGAAERLPAPVQRYLAATGAASKPAFKVAMLNQTGAIRAAPDHPWMSFEAEQVYSAEPPGFLWLARVRGAPLVKLWARDRFVDGRGNMLIRLLGLFTLADGKGAEFDTSAAMRFWGEVILFPELVLSPYVTWEAIDDRSARLRVDQAGLKLEAVVEFGDQGVPVAVHAERFRDVGGASVLTRWSGLSTEWKTVDGRLFPTHWESVWHLEAGDLTAVKIDVKSARTE